ncbi:MAG: hypothetical protein KBS54_03495, partial [Synergistaceae bacterium]|nr:hypothetical protein [Candidatus Equadaptatus faecalis]
AKRQEESAPKRKISYKLQAKSCKQKPKALSQKPKKSLSRVRAFYPLSFRAKQRGGAESSGFTGEARQKQASAGQRHTHTGHRLDTA